MGEGDILGHEPMGIVEEVGSEVTNIAKGDRVVIPFNISCGHCFMCDHGLQSQCETTQVRDQGMGAALFGYTKLYGQVPGGQAEYLRVPQAQYGPIKVPEGPPRRSLRLPLRRAAHRLAGGRVREHPRGRVGRRASASARSATCRTRIAKHQRRRQASSGSTSSPSGSSRARANGIEVLDLATTTTSATRSAG